MKLTIKRSKWARGGHNGDSMLLNGDGNMCCLGFLARKCGYAKIDIRGLSSPEDLAKSPKKGPFSKLVDHNEDGRSNNTLCGDLMDVNDGYNWPRREAKIAKLMAKIGVDVTFVP